jgi:hypothetical protein
MDTPIQRRPEKPRVRLNHLGNSVAYGAFYAAHVGDELVAYFYDSRPPIISPAWRKAA